MARDYKSRSTNKRRKSSSKTAFGLWKGLLIAFLLGGFTLFLIFLPDSDPEQSKQRIKQSIAPGQAAKKPDDTKPLTNQNSHPIEPKFDFYTILPESEVVVPDYETKTIARKERFGKAKPARYIMQAGAFREYKEADRLRARLALMGIESRLEKAGVWTRVKMGPFSRMTSVNRISKQLKEQGINVIVTQITG